MNAILLGLTFVTIVVLDYFWDSHVKPSDETQAKKLKRTIGVFLLVAGLSQITVQFRKEKASDRDNDYLKNQLHMANVSLTNALEAVRGMSDGGSTWAAPSFGWNWDDESKTNTLKVYLNSSGEFPMRNVSVTVINETKRIEGGLIKGATNVPPSEPVTTKFLGDIPRGSWLMPSELCTIVLDPKITNHFRFDITAMNGFSHEIHNIWAVTNQGKFTWQTELHWREKRLGNGLATQEPDRWKGVIMVY